MGIEIERKFLIKNRDFEKSVSSKKHMRQAYIVGAEKATMRIRITEDEAFLTVKGRSNEKGMSRSEYEYEIPREDAEEIMTTLCEQVVEKVRNIVWHNGKCFEVDVFLGDNKGLILAEIELSREDEVFSRPSWLGEEVTTDFRFRNSFLARYPYSKW